MTSLTTNTSSLVLVSSSLGPGGIRRVVVKRPFAASNALAVRFGMQDPAAYFIAAVGSGPTLAYHASTDPMGALALAPMAGAPGVAVGSTNSTATGVGVSLLFNSTAAPGSEATITLTGPADVWFGVAFTSGAGERTMSSAKSALVVSGGVGGGTVHERQLGDHNMGSRFAVGFYHGGAGAECFTWPANAHLRQCAEVSGGDLSLAWVVPPPLSVVSEQEFEAEWSVTASPAFVLRHGAAVGHSNMHACAGVGVQNFGYADCNPFGKDSARFITTRNPQMSAVLAPGIATHFKQRFRGGLPYFHGSGASQQTMVLAHVIAGSLSVALPYYTDVMVAPGGQSLRASAGPGVGVGVGVALAIALVLLGFLWRRQRWRRWCRGGRVAVSAEAPPGTKSGAADPVEDCLRTTMVAAGAATEFATDPRSPQPWRRHSIGESKPRQRPSVAAVQPVKLGENGLLALTPAAPNKATLQRRAAGQSPNKSTLQRRAAGQPTELNAPPVKLFLSYGHGEASDFSRWLRDRLVTDGFEVWFDEQSIDVATNWQSEIGKALVECDALVAVLDEKYIGSEFCTNELAMAASRGKRLYPVLLRGFQWIWLPPGLEYQLATTQAISFDALETDSDRFGKLRLAMRQQMVDDARSMEDVVLPAS